MVISYIKMLYVTSSKKILPWIILALGLVGTICAFYFAIHGSVKQGGGVKTLGNIIYAVPFFGLSFYATIIAIHLFKDHEKDGTELLVISKPLSRKNILLAKFFVLFSLIIAMHFLYFFGMLVATSADTKASMHDKVMPAVSVLVGGFVISTLIASIAIFFSCFIGSLGTLFVTASIVAIFPIAGIVLQQTVRGQHYGNSAKTFAGLNADGTLMEDSSSIYQFPPEGGIHGELTQDEIYQKYKKDDKYASASYGDVWYQWSQFYSVFNVTSKEAGSSKKIVPHETTVPRTQYSIEDKNHVWHTYFISGWDKPLQNLIQGQGDASMQTEPPKNINMQKLEERAKGFYTWISTDDTGPIVTPPGVPAPPSSFPTTGVAKIAWFNNLNFAKRIGIVNAYVANNAYGNGIHMAQRSLYELSLLPEGRVNLYDLFVYNKMKAAHSDITLPGFGTAIAGNQSSEEFFKSFKIAGEKIVSYESKDYIPKGIVVAIWLPIALLLVSLASWRYIKKDFK